MNAKEYVQKYKDKEVLLTVNFEGSLMVGEDELMAMLDEYHKAKLKLLNLHLVDSQRELLIAFAKYWNDKDYGYVKIDDTEGKDPNDIDTFLQQ